MSEKINGSVAFGSEVRTGVNYEGKNVVEIRFIHGDQGVISVIDRATAARLINQLRRALDEDYNRAINERPGGSDDYGRST